MMMETNTKKLRHAVARVAELAELRGLLLRSSQQNCEISVNIRTGHHAALGNSTYFKSLRPQRIESVIFVSTYILNVSCHYAILPLRRSSQCALCGDLGRNRSGEKPLC